MGSIVAEENPIESGNCSLMISPPTYKRRKVSAIRDYPDGCGPNAKRINIQVKEVGINGQKEEDVLKTIECIQEKVGDLCDIVKFPKENGDSQGHTIPLNPNGVNCDKEVCGIEEFQNLPINNPESNMKNEIRDPSKDLVEERLESSYAWKDTSVLYPKEAAHAINDKIMDEGTSVPCFLPHHPIPPNFIWKEPNYPPRRKLSAVRDFPVGCGRNVPELGDTINKHIDQVEPDSKVHKAVALNDADKVERGDNVPELGDTINKHTDQVERDSEAHKASVLNDADQVGEEHEADNVFDDKVQLIVSGKGGDTPEHNTGSDKALLLSNSDGQEVLLKDKNGEQHEKENEQLEFSGRDEREPGSLPDGLNKELVVYVKDRNKKKKSVGEPCTNVGLEEKSIVGDETSTDMVIVQGLMSALYCPWRQGKESVKTTPTVASGKRKKRNKCNYSGQDKGKFAFDKSKNDTKDLADKNKMVVPYLEQKDIGEVSRPLDLRDDDDDDSENDDLNDFQFLPRERICDVNLPPFGASSTSERGVRHKVRETLRLFQVVQRKLLQQEEETKSKDQENTSKRTDLRAAKVLKDHGKYINTKKVIGPVPGVEVGDFFNYRIELAIIGLHGPLQGGIDTMKLGKQTVAISIVASGGYANDVDSSDVLIYTGQGGNSTGGDKQPEDQKLERGNLALKNCIDKKTLVRVIRGFKETKPAETPDGRPKTIATYTYDGLYTVEKYWHDLGPHGKLVYKFELVRVPGQPELAWKEVKQSKKVKAREGRCIADISEGKENVPICAVNTINDERPPPFTYITSMMYPDWCQPIAPKGCDCKNGCSDSEHCACAVRNGGEIPFNYSGAIVQAKPLVYECGPSCKCPPSCPNRVSQHGIKLPLEIFKTDSRGWGVRCLSAISSGTFICEYIGELLDDREAEQRTSNDEYLFDIGQNYNDTSLWEGLSNLLSDIPSSSTTEVIENIGFTIDAVRYGNVGRFINHSCSPNLYAQNVLYDHEDKRIPHIMLFAAENIPPLQELTYHYNYTLDQVFDSEGNIKKKTCHCGSVECTGRMY